MQIPIINIYGNSCATCSICSGCAACVLCPGVGATLAVAASGTASLWDTVS